MKWIGVLIVAPMWGMVSTQLFLQSWLFLINGFINIIGFIAGRVQRKITALGIAMGLGSALLFSILLRTGFWLLSDVLPFGYTTGENIVYWVFAAFSALYMLPQIPKRIKNAWRHAMVPDAIEADIMTRKMSEKHNAINK